jgi:hypothetical protein
LSAASSSGSRFASRRKSRAFCRSRATTWASSAWARTSAAMRAQSAISCSTLNLVAGQLAPAREIAVERLAFPDFPAAIAGHEAGAGVDQRRALHALGEGDDVLGALHVGAQGRFQRRVEGHLARRVDDHVDVAGHARSILLGKPQVGFRDVAVHHAHLVLQKGAQPFRIAVLLAQRIEGVRGHHVIPEARLAGGAGSAPDHDVHAADVGKLRSSMLSSTLPRKPVAPSTNTCRPR